MPSQILVHCQEVQIANYSPPKGVTLSLVVAGTPGDGYVDVHDSPSGGGSLGSVATAGSDSIAIPGATTVYLHYHANSGRPQTVEVIYSFA